VRRTGFVLLLFFASGLSCLVYELLWFRFLSLVLGNTIQASTAVLAAFMTGTALGSLVIGRLMDRMSIHPLRVYAALEAGIGVFALILPVSLPALTPLYRTLYRASGEGRAWLPFVRFSISFLLLLVPTTLMGGTLPALARHFVTASREIASRLGSLYAANTLGGVVGTMLCGFALLPGLGMAGTNLYAATVSLTVAVVAFSRAGATREDPVQEETHSAPRDLQPVCGTAPWKGWVLVTCFALGFGGLALEVIWFRILLLVFGSTTYAFTVMLASFLSGIAAGSASLRRRASHTKAPLVWLSCTVLACSLAIAVTAGAVERLPWIYLKGLVFFGLTWKADIASRVAVSAALMMPTTILLGAAFPLVARLQITELGSIGRGVGTVYATNTAGAMAGAFVGGFCLIPYHGMQRSLHEIAVFIGLFGGLSLLKASAWPFRRRLIVAASLLGGLTAIGATAHPWDRKLLSAGVYMSPASYISADRRILLSQALADLRVLYYQEGKTATVSVLDAEGAAKYLRIDGKTEISTLNPDRRLGRMMGHLPMLFHPEPRIVMNIGLGAGLTVAGLAAHDATRIDVAEIEPLVANATRLFSAENHNVLSDPRLHLIFNDGRNHLLLTDRVYDVITSDPFEPTVGGAANLFTLEHFRAARDRLAPKGIMCQYLPLYEMEWSELGSILKAFTTVFSHVTVWYTGRDAIALGTQEHLIIDADRLMGRLAKPGVRDQLHDVGLDDPYRLLGTFVFDVERNRELPWDLAPNTDAFPYVEFSAPKKRWLDTTPDNIRRLLQLMRPLPEDIIYPSQDAHLKTEAFRTAQELAMESTLEAERGNWQFSYSLASETLSTDPKNPLAVDVLVSWHLREAALLRSPSHVSPELEHYKKARALDPGTMGPFLGLAQAYLDLRQWSEARSWVNRGLTMYPESLELRLCAAAIARGEGRIGEAEEQAASVLRDFPDSTRALLALAEAETARGGVAMAEMHLQKVLEQDGGDAEAHFLMAQIGSRTARIEMSHRHLERALTYGGPSYRERARADPLLRQLLQAQKSSR